MFNEIKEIIQSDTSLILDILESLDCHSIKDTSSEVRCSLPDSRNNTSIRVKKNFHLAVDIFSRNDFSDFEIGDIFSLIQYLRDCNLEDAQKYICSIIGCEYDGKMVEFSKSRSIRELRRFKKKEKKVLKHNILDESVLEKYEKYIVQEWVDEGIDKETQRLFGVFIDRQDKRWCFPIRDEFSNLISWKGRTYVKDYDLKGIYKYVFKVKMGFNPFLYGYWLTAPHIFQKGEVIVAEAEKSVMKAWSFGEKNFVASGKAGLNEYQIKKIIQMQCKRVCLAYDKDIGMEIIQKDIDRLKYYKEVYYIIDENDILGEKDAPVDKGYWNWLTLYEQRKRGR